MIQEPYRQLKQDNDDAGLNKLSTDIDTRFGEIVDCLVGTLGSCFLKLVRSLLVNCLTINGTHRRG